MLKNCFLPVNYNKPRSQTCGEIVCENLEEFIINCKLCKIKIFEFEEFVQHFKNVHLDETPLDNKTEKSLIHREQQLEEKIESDENYERVIKLEITEAIEERVENPIKNESHKNCTSGEEYLWEYDSNEYYDDNDKDYEVNSDDDDDQDDEVEEQSKSIIKKVFCLFHSAANL